MTAVGWDPDGFDDEACPGPCCQTPPDTRHQGLTMDPNVPLGRIVDTSQQNCSYSPGDRPESDCGQPATWHIAWDAQLENGLACDEHMAEAQRDYVYVDRHRVTPDCAMPGSIWFFEEKRCGYPDDPERQAASKAQHATA